MTKVLKNLYQSWVISMWGTILFCVWIGWSQIVVNLKGLVLPLINIALSRGMQELAIFKYVLYSLAI